MPGWLGAVPSARTIWLRSHSAEWLQTWRGISIGEVAFAGSAFTLAVTTVDTVMLHLHPFVPPARWAAEILFGWWPRLMTSAILLLVWLVGEWVFVFIVLLLSKPLFWIAITALLLWLRFRYRSGGAVRVALHVALVLLTLLGTVGVTLYTGMLQPTVTLASQWGLIAVVALGDRVGGLRHRLRRMGALVLVICLATLTVATVTASARRSTRRTLEDRRFITDPAYDLVIAGDQPALVFTNQEQLRIVRAPYGPPGAASEEMLEGIQTERLFPADDVNTFYLASSAHGVRRVSLGERLQIVSFVAEDSRFALALAEDPPQRRFFVLNEWNGTGSIFRLDPPDLVGWLQRRRFFVLDAWNGTDSIFLLDAPDQVGRIQISDRSWPIPWITADPAARRAYVTSPVADGRLRVLDLDRLEFLNERSGFFLYVSAIDPERRLLWATRPLSGELMGIDMATLDVRARIPLAVGTRDIAIDPERHQIFVNTYPYGELFRVDAVTGHVLEVGGCGFRCRSLYIDLPRRTLWAASLEGIYRFPLDRPIGTPPGEERTGDR